MNKNTPLNSGIRLGAVLAAATGLMLAGCGKSDSGSPSASGDRQPAGGKKISIANIGSDTMVNLAIAWADAYGKVDPSVSVEVNGGGSGQGVAALINGACDIANCSRAFEEKEIADFKSKHPGKEPKEFMVGYDALSVFVHKDNPMTEISIDELQQLYMKDGKLSKWSDLGVSNIPGAKGDEVILVSRQNNSGTYHYFREAIVGKKNEMRLGTVDMNGSKDVVDLISKTPNAIGYSGMGYATPAVKHLKVSKKKGDKAVEPTIATTLDKTYPIARPMFMYTAGDPAPHIKKYLDWIMSDAGQKIVAETGYVPLPK
ncbi:MAG: phosphate ABC transporter substrate-binding protein [Verrucomicrobiales bacterium]|nr:phosphate ABC transporter substrate-binding protein [Verrucomicrobiales bacterium]